MTLRTMDDWQVADKAEVVDQIAIREATKADNDALLRLTRATPMG